MIFDDKLLLYFIIFLKYIYVKWGAPSIKKLAPCALVSLAPCTNMPAHVESHTTNKVHYGLSNTQMGIKYSNCIEVART